MALDSETKKSIIDEYATQPGDTGSPEVQVAGSCCSWASVAGCSVICRTSTSSATAR